MTRRRKLRAAWPGVYQTRVRRLIRPITPAGYAGRFADDLIRRYRIALNELAMAAALFLEANGIRFCPREEDAVIQTLALAAVAITALDYAPRPETAYGQSTVE